MSGKILNPGSQDLCGGNRPQFRLVRDANYAYETILMPPSLGYHVSFVLTTSHDSKCKDKNFSTILYEEPAGFPMVQTVGPKA